MELEVSERRKRRPGGQIVTAEEPEERQTEREELEDFLKLAIERFKRAAEAEDRQRRDALDDLEFSTGKQWPAEVSGSRLADGRPCLTMNRLPQFIRQITNEQRQQRPAIQINPVGSGADVDTAEVLQGTVRHIELLSDADVAYDTAFDNCVRMGWGFWRLVLDYLPGTEDLEIFIKRVKNPFTVYFDPSAVEPDYSDARWCFVVEDLTVEEYRASYPDSEAAKLNDFESIGDQAPTWATKDTIRVADYFHIEEETKTVLILEDGTETDEEEYQNMPEDKPPVAKRAKKLDRKVVWDKINAVEILESPEWPGYWIPVIPVVGDDLDVNGVRHIAGIVRHAKDPMRSYNYWYSAATEIIALAPKTPYIGAEGQFEGHEGKWQQANQRNFAYLEYKPQDVRGQPVGPPQRQQYEAPIQSMNQMLALSAENIMATIGIYEANLGKQGPETSGKAILARQKQGDLATSNFMDNLARSIRFTGRQLLDLIPHVYSSAKVQRIIKPDDTIQHVGVYNSQDGTTQEDAHAQLQDAFESQQIKKVYDIGTGIYDVTVSTGPNYKSKREEAVTSMMALVQSYPQVMQIAGDLLVRNMDWPGARDIADRLKKTMPPQLIADEADGDSKTKVLVQQSQLQQQSQLIEQLTQHVNAQAEMIKTKQIEAQNKADIEKYRSDNERELKMLQLLVQRDIAEIQTKAQDSTERLKLAADLDKQLHVSAHEVGMSAIEHKHNMELEQAKSQTLAKQQKSKAKLKPKK